MYSMKFSSFEVELSTWVDLFEKFCITLYLSCIPLYWKFGDKEYDATNVIYLNYQKQEDIFVQARAQYVPA